jgi:hypothetical protein
MIVSRLLYSIILGIMLAVAKKTVVKENAGRGGQHLTTGGSLRNEAA